MKIKWIIIWICQCFSKQSRAHKNPTSGLLSRIVNARQLLWLKLYWTTNNWPYRLNMSRINREKNDSHSKYPNILFNCCRRKLPNKHANTFPRFWICKKSLYMYTYFYWAQNIFSLSVVLSPNIIAQDCNVNSTPDLRFWVSVLGRKKM